MCVFLCKQKAAYEMRISDWSSDVCSSDLLADHEPAALRLGIGAADGPDGHAELPGEIAMGRQPVAGRQAAGIDVLGQRVGDAQIGRTSCRERVCLNV